MRKLAFLFAVVCSFYTNAAFAQTCNDASGFIKTDGPIPLGDLLILGPDCVHVQDGGPVPSVFNPQPANTFLAGPTSGGSATPTFRAQVTADMPLFLQQGTGAVGRTYLSKNQDTLSLKDFGAKCDNSTDDNTAAQNANTAAQAFGIRLLVPGLCKVSGELVVTSPYELFGYGKGVSALAGTTATQQQVTVNGVTGFSMHDLDISSFVAKTGGWGLKLASNSQYADIYNSVFRFQCNAITMSGVANSSVRFNDFDNNSSGCTTISHSYPTSPDSGDNSIFMNWFAGGTGVTFIDWTSGGGTNIAFNKFFNGSIAVHAHPDTTLTANRISQFTLDNNSFDGQSTDGALFDGGDATHGLDLINIVNNKWAQAPSDAFLKMNGVDQQTFNIVAINGNTVGTSGSGTVNGFNIQSAARTNVSGNTMTGTNVGSAIILGVNALYPVVGPNNLTQWGTYVANSASGGVIEQYDPAGSRLDYLAGLVGFQQRATAQYDTFTNIAAPASPSAGTDRLYTDSTDLRLHDINASGVIGTTVVASNAVANQFVTAISSAGVISRAQPTIANLSGLGTGVATALGNAANGAGGFVTSPVANANLANSTISGVALGGSLNVLSYGTHLTNSAGASSYNGSAASTVATDATNLNTASTIVARDASGNFSAGTITASLTGHSSLDCALAGCTMSGNILMGGNTIDNVIIGTSTNHLAANFSTIKFYTTALVGGPSLGFDGSEIVFAANPGGNVQFNNSTQSVAIAKIFDAGNFQLLVGHILASQIASPPTVSSCGTSPSAITGGDNFGSLTAGSGALTSCVINFGAAWTTAPSCTFSSPTAITSPTVNTSTTQLTIGGGSLTSLVLKWVCGSSASLDDIEPVNDNINPGVYSRTG